MLVWTILGAAAALAFALWSCTPLFHRERVVEDMLAPPDPERIMPGASPVERRAPGNRSAILCIHGFPSTPANFGRAIADGDRVIEGYDLYAPLWPGCGTAPGDIGKLNWATALEAHRRAYLGLRRRYERVFLVGESAGGSVALALAEEFDGAKDPGLACAGIATIGSPVVLNALFRHGMVKSPLLYLARFLGLFSGSLRARLPDPARPDRDGDSRWLGYLGLWPRFSYSMWMGLRAIERALPSVRCPILALHCRTDRVIDYRNAAIIQRNVGSRMIRAYTANMDGREHLRHSLLLYDSEREAAWAAILAFFAEAAREGD